MDSAICTKFDPETPNRLEKFADDFVLDFHQSVTPTEAVDLATKFLDVVKTRPADEQLTLLKRADLVDTATGCGTKLPRLDIVFWKTGNGKEELGKMIVLTEDASHSWKSGFVKFTAQKPTEVYNKLIDSVKQR